VLGEMLSGSTRFNEIRRPDARPPRGC